MTATNTEVETRSTVLTYKFTVTYTTFNSTSLTFYVTSNSSMSSSHVAPSCIIATAAYGSSMAGPVQFLRQFRDGVVNKTVLGSGFLTAFNAWYYSWAPSVARVESTSSQLRVAVQVLIAPLIGSLLVAQAAFEAIRPLNPEIAILLAGSFAAAMIGTIYLAPPAYVVLRMVKLGRRRILAYTSGLALVLALFGTSSTGSVGFWQIGTSVLVLEIVLMTPVWIITSFRVDIFKTRHHPHAYSFVRGSFRNSPSGSCHPRPGPSNVCPHGIRHDLVRRRLHMMSAHET
jgi:hypothetical protein